MVSFIFKGEIDGIVWDKVPGKTGKSYDKAIVAINVPDNSGKPGLVAVEFFGRDSAPVQSFKKGDAVEVSAYVSSHEWKGRYFSKVSGVAINADTTEHIAPAPEDVSTSDGTEAFGSADIPF